MSNKVIAEWLDGLERILESEAKLSGLLESGATIGQAREFLVRRVLKTILPPMAHIGTGKAIDYAGNTSKQIDIIVYDPRFPLMEVDGGGLYYAEGVIATIEVKSTINKREELEGALENCKSVLVLGINGEYPEEAAAQVDFYMEKGGLRADAGADRFDYMLHPATYVFGFNSKLSHESTTLCIKNWWDRQRCPDGQRCAVSAYFPYLPRVITSGNVVGVVSDGRFSPVDKEGKSHAMTVFQTPFRFRWLALHLMDVVSRRLGLRNYAERFDYRLGEYYPLKEYVEDIERSGEAKFIDRQPPI
jgi:hypothetical protein